MAVPSSGELSLLGIRREVGSNNYNSSTNYTNISLEDLSDGTVATINTSNNSSDRPDQVAPHAMSEFYSYDHDLASTSFSPTSFTGVTLGGDAGDTASSSNKSPGDLCTLVNPEPTRVLN